MKRGLRQVRALARMLGALGHESRLAIVRLLLTAYGPGLPAGEDSANALGRLRRYRDLGVTHVCLETSFRDMDRAYATLERFAAEVRPQL